MQSSLNSLRAGVGAAVLLAMCAAAFQPVFIRAYFVGGAALHHDDKVYEPDRGNPGFREFLEGVAARTRPGESIVIVVPAVTWRSGYDYAYHRASFILAGRRVLPLVSHDETALAENIDRADYIAAWGVPYASSARLVWRAYGGALYVRRGR